MIQLANILGTISSDSYKVDCFKPLLLAIIDHSQPEITPNEVIALLKKISSDSYKVNLVTIIKEANLLHQITCDELMELLEIFASNANKVKFIQLFADQCDQSNVSMLCAKLSVSIVSKTFFHEACVTLNLPEDIYQSYEEGLPNDEIMISSGNLLINGQVDMVHITREGNKKITTIKKGKTTQTIIEYS
jgi:hypothetical protein